MKSIHWLLLLCSLAGQAAPSVRVALIKTADAETRGMLAVAGGSWGKLPLVHTAVLVSHPQGELLFDTGLGTQVDAQVDADMPWWAGPFLRYQQPCPAVRQLAGRKIPRIILSHAHWDHVSGLVDFPDSEVWVTSAERQFIASGTPPTIFPSQVHVPPIKWREYSFAPQAWLGYPLSLDLFGDGSAVLVPMAGHTPGSVGLFTRLASGRSLFFVGDTIWTTQALDGAKEKSWFARQLADNDRDATAVQIRQLAQMASEMPQLQIVPAHDAAVQEKLGYYPNWVDEPPSKQPSLCPTTTP